jgi:fatty-acid peroxygenase
MKRMPPRASLDRSMALLRRGYLFTRAERGSADTEPFQVRLLGRRTPVVGGRDGAELFYDQARFRRSDAVPAPLKNTLFGKGAVHGLDDAEHLDRKALFVALLTPAAAVSIARLAGERWDETVAATAPGEQLCVFATAVRIHADVICRWAGVPTSRVDGTLAGDLAAMVDGFGSVGARHLRGRRARRRRGRWAARLIADARSGALAVPAGSAVRTIADHCDPDGGLLTPEVAGVELINILRPTVAVAWFAAFTALALHKNPQWRERARTADDATLESFAHEVRRLYPFVPVLAAVARCPFRWHGLDVRAGQRVLLDVYGTLHDPALWSGPERFAPDRFAGLEPDPFTLIPQGGGDTVTGHRCPGERVAIELIKTTAVLLAGLDYDVPEQDLRVPTSRMPTRPRSGFVLTLVPR